MTEQRDDTESFAVSLVTKLIEPGKNKTKPRLSLATLETNTPYYAGDKTFLTIVRNDASSGYDFNFYQYNSDTNQWNKTKTMLVADNADEPGDAAELKKYCATMPLLEAVPTKALATGNADYYLPFINSLARDGALNIDTEGQPEKSMQRPLSTIQDKLAESLHLSEHENIDAFRTEREKPRLVLARDKSGNLLAGIATSTQDPRNGETITTTEWYIFETHAEDTGRNKKWQPVDGGLALEKTLVDPENKDDVKSYIERFRTLSGAGVDDHKGGDSVYDVMFDDKFIGDDKFGFKGNKEISDSDPEVHLKASFMRQFNNPNWDFLKPPPYDIPDYKFEMPTVDIGGSANINHNIDAKIGKETAVTFAVVGATMLGALGIGAYALKNRSDRKQNLQQIQQQNAAQNGSEPASGKAPPPPKKEESWVSKVGKVVVPVGAAATIVGALLLASRNNDGGGRSSR